MSTYTYRTFNLSPPDYERELSDALFAIMGHALHDPSGIVAELNKTGPKPMNGDGWTIELFKSELQRLGTWTHCIGAPVGSHGVPGASERTHGL